jgi:hypothetical protein
MKARALRTGLLMLMATAALSVTTEALLRVVFPNRAPRAPAYRFDEDYLISLKPNAEQKFVRSAENGGDSILWRTNSAGFRGPELEPAPTRRIIVYGDSNIEARFSKQAQTFTARLEEALATRGVAGAEVVNAGVAGFGPDQSLIRLGREVDAYRPDILILHIFADNDFGDMVRNRLFDLTPDGDVVRTSFETSVDEVLFSRNTTGRIYNSLLYRAATKVKNTLFGVTPLPDRPSRQEQLQTLRQVSAEEYAVFRDSAPRVFSHFADHYDVDLALDPDAESSGVKKRLMEGVLRRTQAVVKTKDVRLLVLIQPSIVDLTRRDGLLDYGFLEGVPGYAPTNLSDQVQRSCRALGIEFVNLFALFAENDPETLFFVGGDNHWNDHGQDLAAQSVAAVIVDQKLLD